MTVGQRRHRGRVGGEDGIGYCFGHFLRPHGTAEALAAYRERSTRTPLLATRVFVAASAARARALAADFLLWRARKDLGANEPLPADGEAGSHPWTNPERIRAADDAGAIVVGDPAEVRDHLVALAAEHRVDEIVVNTLTPDLTDCIRTYELLAEAFAA